MIRDIDLIFLLFICHICTVIFLQIFTSKGSNYKLKCKFNYYLKHKISCKLCVQYIDEIVHLLKNCFSVIVLTMILEFVFEHTYVNNLLQLLIPPEL